MFLVQIDCYNLLTTHCHCRRPLLLPYPATLSPSHPPCRFLCPLLLQSPCRAVVPSHHRCHCHLSAALCRTAAVKSSFSPLSRCCLHADASLPLRLPYNCRHALPSLLQSLCSIVVAIPLGLHCHCHHQCCHVLAAAVTIPSSHRRHVLAAADTVPCHCNLVIVPSPSQTRCRVIAVVALPSPCHRINAISVAVLLPSCCRHAVVMSSSYHHCVLVVASLLCSCCHSRHAALSSSSLLLIVASLPYHRCCHRHIIVLQSACALTATVAVPGLAATVAVLLRHHRSPSPSHEWACIEWV